MPTSVSPQARAVLAGGVVGHPPHPPRDDPDAWRTMIAATDETMAGMLGVTQLEPSGSTASIRMGA
ncbi:hypothetical protein [Parafrankia sp. EUN1f]|uniref:hypothetical protein n=1 Tax=Parafrankia sp. EUN1f TaxID=102897 RepID=UPI00055ED47D|nr:hypothetical protein [Parafrankia sp. EUN1f]